jgi:hypothetical protein
MFSSNDHRRVVVPSLLLLLYRNVFSQVTNTVSFYSEVRSTAGSEVLRSSIVVVAQKGRVDQLPAKGKRGNKKEEKGRKSHCCCFPRKFSKVKYL